MEEMYQDPEFVAWLEQRNKDIREQWDEYQQSIEQAYDIIASEMNDLLEKFESLKTESEFKDISQWDLLTELKN
jgi:DNA anti-recombination protein RmuC